MSFLEILDTLLLKPLELIFEVVYMFAYKVIGNPGLSIVALSLFINFLVLPLYMRADVIQEEQHAIEKKLQKGVDHIKKTFRGDERMMMLQAYYRQNNYKPVYVLRSALSLFLQIPFFIAAYRFLSGLSLLDGAPLGPIADLGNPDGMLAIGEVSFNLLPFIMTAVNLISCIIFTKGGLLKTKIQLYAMALFFLVFLYFSPAGLVFYWTLNNVFSLVKTIFYKLKDPRKILRTLSSGSGIMVAVYGFIMHHELTGRKTVFVAAVAILLQSPLIWELLKGGIRKRMPARENRKTFLGGAVFLTILTGALIPSSVVSASPLEFITLTDFYNPLWHIVSSVSLAFGIFVVWTGVFYFLAKPAARVYFDKAMGILAGVAVANYMLFGKNLGMLREGLVYEKGLNFTWEEQIENIIVVVAVAVISYVMCRYKNIAADILIIASLAICCMTAVNVAGIHTAISEVKERDLDRYMAIPEITFSKTGKNVIVLMLDRAVGEYVPYFFQEKPELEEQFAGFTYYENTLSFGAHTNFGAPALYGGYDYTPAEINKRDKENLVDKHNEALKVMPTIFAQNGYQVMVCDPPYAGYQWVPDLSIYDDRPEIQTYILNGKFTVNIDNKQNIATKNRNFFCFAVMKIMPLCLQKTIYDYGNYNQAYIADTVEKKQIIKEPYTSIGTDSVFMDRYNALASLPSITKIVEKNTDTFLMMSSDITHDAVYLQEPEYVPAEEVDNTEYETANQERYTFNGHTLRMTYPVQMATYQVNMAAFIQLGKWFDYMREKGVYDNTRIILVSDHGKSDIIASDEHRLGADDDIVRYYPLLMAKDFNEEEFTVSEDFMTNGDVPMLALKDIIEEPVNPYTGNIIDSHEKTAHDQYIITSDEIKVEVNNGVTYFPSTWYAVHDDMRDAANWKLLSEEKTILPPVN